MPNTQFTGSSEGGRDPEETDPTLEEHQPANIASVGSGAGDNADVEPAFQHVPDNDGEPVTDE